MASSFWMRSQMVQGRYLYVECRQTPNVADNTSTIHWTLVSTGGSSSFYTTGPTQVLIGGNLVYEKERVSYSAGQFPAAKGSVSGTTTVKHDDVTGEATIAVTIYTMIYNGVQETRTEYWTLDPNPRFAVLQSAPDFHDEENPVITYSNPAGTQATALQAGISLTGEKDDIAYRDIPKNATSYTFSLSEAERNVLCSAFPNANSGTVQFCVRSVIGGNTQVSVLPGTFSIKEPNPVITPTIVDNNDTTYALTGDQGKLVRYYSDAKVTIGAQAVKKSTLKSQKVTCGKEGLTADGTFHAVENSLFSFAATDSRGNTATKTVELPMVPYVKLTCSLSSNMPSTDGNMIVQASGHYFNGSFGGKSNSLKVYYRYKAAGGAYGSWEAMTITLRDNTYSATANITGLDYQTGYIFQAYAEDALATVYASEQSVRAQPVFDWDKDDFNFNVSVHAPSLTLTTPLTIESGGTGVKLSGLNQDYAYTVYPLCKISTTANTHLDSGTQGVFYFRRANGLEAPKFLSVQAENQYSGANRFNISTMGEIAYNAVLTVSSGYGFRTCRFQMDSVWYGGIAMAISNANFNRVSFVGTSVANTVKGIDIYNRNTGAILNSEIYNSIVYDAGDFKNGLYRNAGTIGLEAYPINSIYISYSHSSPAALFGGTWQRLENRFLWGTSASGTIGATAGEQTHTLTASEMPSHSHDMPFSGSSSGVQSPYKYIVLSSAASNGDGGKGYRNNMGTFAVGDGAAHNNMPPYIQVSIWRRTA